MRPRRRRSRGPRPIQPGGGPMQQGFSGPGGAPPLPGAQGGPSAGGGGMSGPPDGRGGDGGERRGRRRRRRSRGPRPLSNAAPQPYGNGAPQGGGGGGRQQRRRGRDRGGRPQRRGLEVLRDLQQIGYALDPTERLILELPPGKGSPPYGDRITGRAIDLIAPL